MLWIMSIHLFLSVYPAIPLMVLINDLVIAEFQSPGTKYVTQSTQRVVDHIQSLV